MHVHVFYQNQAKTNVFRFFPVLPSDGAKYHRVSYDTKHHLVTKCINSTLCFHAKPFMQHGKKKYSGFALILPLFIMVRIKKKLNSQVNMKYCVFIFCSFITSHEMEL